MLSKIWSGNDPHLMKSLSRMTIFFLFRKDHIGKIDTAQKSHDQKWGFLNDLQPQVGFLSFYSSVSSRFNFLRQLLTIQNDHLEHFSLVLVHHLNSIWNLLKNNVPLKRSLFLLHLDQCHQRQVIWLVGVRRIKTVLWKNSVVMLVDKNHCIKSLNGLLKALNKINISLVHMG